MIPWSGAELSELMPVGESEARVREPGGQHRKPGDLAPLQVSQLDLLFQVALQVQCLPESGPRNVIPARGVPGATPLRSKPCMRFESETTRSIGARLSE